MLSKARVSVALAATVLGAAGALSATGSAQSPAGGRTLHFVATTTGGFESGGAFRNGVVFGFRDRIKTDDGTTGRDVAACVATDVKRKESLCHIAVVLPGGQLALEIIHRESSKSAPVTVIGGTGAYAGASGSASAKTLSETKTDITITFVD